jgi:hypothetical protein
MIVNRRPPGKCRAAYSLTASGPTEDLPAPAREEAEQRKHQDDDQDDPEDAHAV